jgi:hypothetical protein
VRRLLSVMTVIVALLAAPALAATPVPAPTEGLNLTTSPLPISLVVLPGHSVSTQLRVKNSGTQTETLQLGLMKFAAFGEEGKPILLDRAPSDTYFDWVHFSQAEFVAEPGVWKTVNMTINVPSSAAFGYYYAVTFSRASQSGLESGTRGTSIHGATATLVLLEARVPGAKRDVQVLDFKTTHRLYEFLPTDFSLRLHNAGNVHVAPVGSIFITKGGKTVSTIDVNREGGNILPGSNRIFTASWTDGFPVYVTKMQNGAAVHDKQGNVVKQLKWDFTQVPKLRMGHYTAKLFLVYDNGSRDVPVQAEVSFWVIPWRLFGVLIVVLVLVGIGLWSSLGKAWRRARRRP